MRVLISKTSLLFLAVLFFPLLASSQWSQTIGPYGGQALTFLPKGDSIFVGTEGGGMFYSTDAGKTWVRSDPGISLRRVTSFTEQGGRIFAGTSVGMLRSDDGGASWQFVNGNLPDTTVTVVGGIGRFVLAGFSGFGLCRSSDGGSQWEVVDTSGLREPLPAMLTVDSLVFLGTPDGCFFSADSGLTWIVRNNGMKGIPAKSLLANGETMFAGSKRTIFRSTDLGANWEESGNGLDDYGANAFAVSGQNLFAGTDVGVYQSVDNGDLWVPVNTGLNDLKVNALVVSSSTLFAGTDGGISRTNNNGASWEGSNDGFSSTRVRALLNRGPYVFAATRGNGVYRTSNNGQNWLLVDRGLTNKNVSDLVNSGNYLIAGTMGGIFRSDDNGENWDTVMQNPSNPNITTLLASGPAVYAGTDAGLFVSTNDGNTWAPSGLDTVSVKSMAVSGFFFFAGSVGDGMFRSSDNGMKWDVIDPNHLTDTTIAALAGNNLFIFAGTGSNGIFRSADNGNTWEAVNAGMADTSVQAILVTDKRLFIGTLGQGAFTSTDSGRSWTPWNDNLQKKELLSLLLVGSTILGGTTGWGVESRPIPPATPVLTHPAEGAVDIPVPSDLSWTSALGATSYEVEICLSGVFDTLAVDEAGISSTTFQLDSVARNTNYYWRVRASGPGGDGFFSGVRTFKTTETAEFIGEVIHPFPGTPLESTDYRLISIPGIPTVTFADVLPGTLGADWSVYEDTGVESSDHLVGVNPDSPFGVGKGYWAVSKGLLDFTGSIAMPPLDADGTYRIDLHDGWNIIGNPFGRAVGVDAIRAANPDTSMNFWAYTGDDPWVDTMATLRPFEGFYFKNLAKLDSMRIPYPFPAAGPFPLPESVVEWKIQVILETIAGNDRLNFIGIAPEALQGKDGLDKPKPVSFGESPYLTFVGEDGNNEILGSDFRPALGKGQVWNFDVVNPRQAKATLRLPRDETVPQGIRVVLVNVDANEQVDVMADSIYSYETTRGKMRFMLIVGGGEFVDGMLESTIPEEFALSQNFPNPFNPETALGVGIPYDSDIRLSVYSILGEEVDVLASGTYAPGRYTFVWKGANSSGNPVASGVYFARFVADGKQMFLRKMMLLR